MQHLCPNLHCENWVVWCLQLQGSGVAQGLMMGRLGSAKVASGRMSHLRVWVIFWIHIFALGSGVWDLFWF